MTKWWVDSIRFGDSRRPIPGGLSSIRENLCARMPRSSREVAAAAAPEHMRRSESVRWRALVDHLTLEYRHLAHHGLELVRSHGVGVAVPDGEIRRLTSLEGSGLLLHEQLPRGPNGV